MNVRGGDNEIDALPASEGGDGTEGSEEQFAGGSPLPSRESQSEGRKETKQQLFEKQSVAVWPAVISLLVVNGKDSEIVNRT